MNQRIRTCLLLAVLWVCASSNALSQSAASAVYDAIAESSPEHCKLLVANRTEVEAIDASASKVYARALGADAATARAFAFANRSSRPIDWSPRKRAIDFVTKPEDMKGQAMSDMLEKVENKSSCGAYLYSFSAVGLSPSGTHAMVMVNRYCSVLCGGGSDILYLVQRKGKWTIARSKLLSVN